MEDRQNQSINRNFDREGYWQRRERIMEQYRRAFEDRRPGTETLMLSGVPPKELRGKLP